MNHNILTIVFTLFTFNTIFAQTETPEQRLHELGVVVNGNLGLGADYKVGTDKSLWRFSALSTNGQWNHNYLVGQPSTPRRFDNRVGVSIGHEWRKSLFEHFFFASGVQLGMTYDLETEDDPEGNFQRYTSTHRFRPSVGAVLGIRYILKDKINFSLTWIPSVSYTHSTTKVIIQDQQTIVNENWEIRNGLGYIINWSSLRLVIAYRFYTDKKKKEKTAPPTKS